MGLNLHLRQVRIGLDATIALFGFLMLILCGVEIKQYPPDYDSTSNGVWAICVLGVPGGVMALFCSIDMLLHFVRPRSGIHRKTALGVLIFFLIGTFVAYLMAIVFRYVSGDEVEGVGLGLNKYQDGDEYFWPSWAFAVASWLCHLALCITVGSQSRAKLHAVKNNKTHNNSAV